MYVSWRRLCCLSSWCLLAGTSSGADASTTNSFPATVEFDLVFPRNDTYAPTTLFPIVFAAQNSHYAAVLEPAMTYRIFSMDDYNKGRDYELDLRWSNFSSTDPFFTHAAVRRFLNVEGTWGFLWSLSTVNCSYGTGLDGAVGTGGTLNSTVTVFTTKLGAPLPDLVAATDASTCAEADSRAFNLTGLMDDTSCAILSSTVPLPASNPCAVKVDSAIASSISAAMTSTDCTQQAHPVVSCPPDGNGAGQAGTFRVGKAAWLIATFSCLACMLV